MRACVLYMTRSVVTCVCVCVCACERYRGTGLVSKRPGEMETEHYATREQPNGDQLHVEP